MRRITFGTVAAASAAMILAGAASAQSGDAPRERPPQAAKPEAAPKPPRPPASLVGRDVVNKQGEPIGKVKAIVGTQVIVSIDDAVDATGRDVALPWEKLAVSGEGETLRLQTELTREQLKLLMPYRASGSPLPL